MCVGFFNIPVMEETTARRVNEVNEVIGLGARPQPYKKYISLKQRPLDNYFNTIILEPISTVSAQNPTAILILHFERIILGITDEDERFAPGYGKLLPVLVSKGDLVLSPPKSFHVLWVELDVVVDEIISGKVPLREIVQVGHVNVTSK